MDTKGTEDLRDSALEGVGVLRLPLTAFGRLGRGWLGAKSAIFLLESGHFILPLLVKKRDMSLP